MAEEAGALTDAAAGCAVTERLKETGPAPLIESNQRFYDKARASANGVKQPMAGGLPPAPHPSIGMRGLPCQGPETHRSRPHFPAAKRRPISERTPEQVEEARQLHLRLLAEPSPRHHGVDCNTLDIAYDRGAFRAIEMPYQETSHKAALGWLTISHIPRDHVEWAAHQAREDKLQAGPEIRAAVARGGFRQAPEKPLAPRGECGLKACTRRRGDIALHEDLGHAPHHPCGPGPCFPTEYAPKRGVRLP